MEHSLVRKIKVSSLIISILILFTFACKKDRTNYQSFTDKTPPHTPTLFIAQPSDSKVVLTWSNPIDLDFAGVKVVYKINTPPLSHNDGMLAYIGKASSTVVESLKNDSIYYFLISAFDTANNYSEYSLTSAIPNTESSNEPFRIFLSPRGSDDNDGLTVKSPLLTISEAQIKLKKYKPILDCDVEVRIKHISDEPYKMQNVIWTYTSDQHFITFMPSDFEYGDNINTINGRPIFDGDGLNNFFFRLNSSSGSRTNIRFYYIQVEDYISGAIIFNGSATDKNHWNGYNTVYGCYFTKIGNNNYAQLTSVGYAGIDLVNSDFNIIQHNQFSHLENRGEDGQLLHAVYLAHNSENNLIESNIFYYISGDPIRVRDYSNNNKVYSNQFTRTGTNAFISDWYDTDECKSWENEFRNNTPLHCSYSGESFNYYWQFITNYPDDCESSGVRIHTSGNDPLTCH